jgi:hypothetical protein
MAHRSKIPPRSPSSVTTATQSSHSSTVTPSSVFSSTTTTSILSGVDNILAKSQGLLNRFELTVSYEDVRWDLLVSPEEKRLISPHAETFPTSIGQDKSKQTSISTPITLAASFLGYLLGEGIPYEVLQIVLIYFERDFLSADIDLHSRALNLEAQTQGTQVNLLKTYHAALRACKKQGVPCKSALFQAAHNGQAHLCAVFGGQELET